MVLPIPAPEPEDWTLDWEALVRAWPSLRALSGCPQDPIHHAEGDVWTHTKLVCEALAQLDGYRSLGPDERALLMASAALHDIAKPATTRCEADGRVTAPGHSRKGAVMARQLLWEQGVPFSQREALCGLIQHHQVPFWLVERADAARAAHGVSQTTRCDHLGLLAEADLRGRVCQDREKILDAIALYRELCAEEQCLTGPRAFATGLARFGYFSSPGRDPGYVPYDDGAFEAVLLCGLPGVGKDHWVRTNRPEWPVVSLDGLRGELGVSVDDEQGAVVQAARERAREHLRARRPFVWNATNLPRDRRSALVSLFTSYGARVRIVYVEVPRAVQRAQNRARPAAQVVPDEALARMMNRWELPDPTEAPTVEYAVTDAV